MALSTLGIILYVAYQSMQPCEKVFVDLAKISNPGLESNYEQVYLEEFATAACETSNPDALWLLAKQESNFRFMIVRENARKAKIHEGQDAINFLAEMKKKPKAARYQSIDIGALQFNWKWHKGAFENDPIAALSPTTQVNYFIKKYSNEIFKRCEDRWVGCYHNQADEQIGAKYQASVVKRNKKFTLISLNYLNGFRLAMNPDERAKLPAIEKEDFYRVFEIAKSFPLPKKVQGDIAINN